MNMTGWRSEIQQFKDLLRIPVGDDEEGVRAECRSQIEKLAEDIPGLVFESYEDWFDQDDDWLLANLGQVLSPDQDAELLGMLNRDDGQGVISYLLDTCIDDWKTQAAAAAEFAMSGEGGADQLAGTESTAGWTADAGGPAAKAEPWGPVWIKGEDDQWKYGLTADGPFIYADGAAAIKDQEIVDYVVSTMRERYPNSNETYLLNMARQNVLETARARGI